MNRKTPLIPALLFVLALGSLATPVLWSQVDAQSQDDEPTAEERRATQIERLKRAQEESLRATKSGHVKTLREMQGAWQLVKFVASDLADAGRQDAGFLLVGDEFLSIEIHMAYFDADGYEQGSFMQTGIYRVNFNADGMLMATCLIGSVDDGTGLTAPQPPGIVSTYDIDLVRGSLFMTSADGSRFEFERVARGALTNLIYEETDWLPGAEARAQRRAVLEASAEPKQEPEQAEKQKDE